MSIYLVDRQCWFLVTHEEAKRILGSGLKPEEYTQDSIQQYLLY
ncbi:hypothetical protein [Clostridium sp.]